MAIWPAMLLSPFLALANLSITYALVTPQCRQQTEIALHMVALVSLVSTLIFTWMAWREWQSQPHLHLAEDDAPKRHSFLAAVAMMAGAFSCLVILAQWIPQWVLSPCTV